MRRVAQLLILALGSAVCAAEGPLDTLAGGVRKSANVPRAIELMRRVYGTDRWFTFAKFEETSRNLSATLQQAGLSEVTIDGAPADGRSQAGFWTMPLAWNVQSARLEMITPERTVLCDYAAVPASLGMWSGPTPAGGVEAELVDIRRTPWTAVRGKLVLTDKNSAGLKHLLAKHGALGAVNGWAENPSLKDARHWVNAWGDNGWAFTATSTPLVSFSVSPNQADRLRELMASGKTVRVRADVQAAYSSGRYPYVSALLPGSTNEEVLVLGHTSEQGANDNATGVAASIEALRTIQELIVKGTLPKPRRGIRILLMGELYGSLDYVQKNRDRMRRTVAALTVDTPAASYDLAGTEYTVYRNPHVALSWTDALIARVAEASVPRGRPWHRAEHTTGTDAYLGDPTVGVPDVWIYSGTGVNTHHNSEDTPETVDPRSLHDLITIIATYLYYAANAGEEQLPWLESIMLDLAFSDMTAAASTAADAAVTGNDKAAAFGLDRIAYLAARHRNGIEGLRRLAPQSKRAFAPALARIDQFRDLLIDRLRGNGAAPAEQSRNPEAQKMIVVRKRLGTIPMDDLPQEKWEGYPSGAWNKLVTIALYWCDGRRNLNEVIRLTEMEMGRPLEFDFVGYFRFLQKHGYVDFR